ncbi:unnamed protein product [Leptidea sinapis]|uniref:Uncharacterized protein n=1 Tax=Leptidea sinapis TaxID=189913 RepID=A0A5E4PXN7_9NEOP|nr:unnamed protein product [Leptidea sinapis]
MGVYTASDDGTMKALASATKLVPYDSALFLMTDREPGDPQRLPLALRALVEKRLKVYTIWTNPNYPSKDSEQSLQDLRNDLDKSEQLAELQQWEPSQVQRRQAKMRSFSNEDDLDTILVRRGGGEAISLGVPVENGVSALKVIIEGLQIDLYNASSVRSFSIASSVRCDTCNYRLRIAAKSMLHFNVDVGDDTLIMKVSGAIARIRDAAIIDEFGSDLAKLPFSYQPTADLEHDLMSPLANIETEVTVPSISTSSFYVKIIGRDIKGEPFIRVAGPILQEKEVRMGRSANVVFPESPNDLERAEEINSLGLSSTLYGYELQRAHRTIQLRRSWGVAVPYWNTAFIPIGVVRSIGHCYCQPTNTGVCTTWRKRPDHIHGIRY